MGVMSVIEVLGFMERDSLIYSVIERIADGLTDRRRRQRYSEQQKLEIARKLEGIIALKLPAKNYIQHDGFKIIASVQLARIRGLKGIDWVALIASARKLPNKTDVLYVLTVIATAMPNREAVRRAQLLAECVSGCDMLPCVVDRIDLYETIAHECWGVDSSTSRKVLELAMKLPLQQYGEEVQGQQRRIIDFANKLDPELATSMASLLDDDPARSPNQRKAREQLESFEFRQKLMDSKVDVNDLPEEELSDLPEASWRLLASLNADRVATVDNGRVRAILRKGSDSSLSEAYPILSWAIANNRSRYSATDQASTLVASAFHSAVECARLALRVAAHRVERNRVLKKAIISTAIQDSIIVGVGHREEGKAFLQAWLAKEPYQYLKICDPYFGPDDLEVLKIILAVQPNMIVQILTSYKHQKQVMRSASFDSTYHEAWRMIVSDQSPPDTEIFIVGTQTTGALPIHDRWWITDKAGIRLGSSYNSLGLTQDSEI